MVRDGRKSGQKIAKTWQTSVKMAKNHGKNTASNYGLKTIKKSIKLNI